MKKSEYTAWYDLSEKTKWMIFNHLFAVSIIKNKSDRDHNNAIMEQFHNDICVNNKVFPPHYEIHGCYKLFFEWLTTAEHQESTFNIYHHVRAFKSFMTESNKPTLTTYKSYEPIKLPKPDKNGCRIIHVSSERLRKGIEIVEMYRGSKSGSMDFMETYYNSAVHTLESRGEKI
jgi:hypothetical protein